MLPAILALTIVLFLLLLSRLLGGFQDSTRGEPVLVEEALLHAKSDYTLRYRRFYYLHFYVAQRDTVVECRVSREIWDCLEKGDRGILCHQGGCFHSFQRGEEVIAARTLRSRGTD